jgi:hypothetical protein
MSKKGTGFVSERTVHSKALELPIGVGEKAGVKSLQDRSRVYRFGVDKFGEQGQPRDKFLFLRSLWDVGGCEGEEERDKITVVPLSERWT